MPGEAFGLSPTTYTHKYSVPIVFSDVSPADGLLSAFDSIAHLSAVTKDVFDAITARISAEKGKISSLMERIQSAQKRVAEIGANAGRVTTIYSTCKYPAPKVLSDCGKIVGNDLLLLEGEVSAFKNQLREQLPHKIPEELHNTAAPPTDTSALFQHFTKIRISHSPENASSEFFKDSLDEDEQQGLGRLPAYLPSVSSILLFNTDENPYKTYNSLNNLEGTGGEDRKQQTMGPSEAPKSILEGADLPSFAGFQFDYKPLLGELPQLQLPTNLPLSKLADISFGVEGAAPSIAPSIGPALPSLDMLALPAPTTSYRKEAKSTVPLALMPATSSTTTTSSAPSISSVPAPPAAPSAPAAPAAPAAPPAPAAPAAPSAPAPYQSPPEQNEGGGGDDDGGGDDARSALLSAIRGSNMTRLKKVGDRLKEKEKAREKKLLAAAAGGDDAAPAGDDGGDGGGGGGGGGGGMDLMAALRERVQRRRHVISGKNQDEGVKAVVAAPAPAAAAPPLFSRAGLKPPRKADSGSGESNGDDKKMSHLSDVVKAKMQAHSKKEEEEADDW